MKPIEIASRALARLTAESEVLEQHPTSGPGRNAWVAAYVDERWTLYTPTAHLMLNALDKAGFKVIKLE